MPITDLLRRNAREFGEDTALVEINPEHAQKRRVTWKEYELIEPANAPCYRREITWREFDEHANRFANLLLSRGLGQGQKGGHPANELPGMAAHILWYPQGRRAGRAAQFPLYGG